MSTNSEIHLRLALESQLRTIRGKRHEAPSGLTPLPPGGPGQLCFRRKMPGLGTFTVHGVDPERDAVTVHDWMSEPVALRWMAIGTQWSVSQYQDFYRWLAPRTDHRAYLIRRDGTPTSLLHLSDPSRDEAYPGYTPKRGDLKGHYLFGTRGPGANISALVIAGVVRFIFSDPAVRRIVVDPDIRHTRAIQRAVRSGFELGPVVDLRTRSLQILYLTRQQGLAFYRTTIAEAAGRAGRSG